MQYLKDCFAFSIFPFANVPHTEHLPFSSLTSLLDLFFMHQETSLASMLSNTKSFVNLKH